MNGFDVKEAMEQVHISAKMQEEIIMNIQNQMKNGKNNGEKNGEKNGKERTGNWKKMAAVAAAFVLAAGVVSFPVRAFVESVVKERMESVPVEEMESLNDMVQSQHDVLADGYSREYSDSEKERSKALWQAYENGTFPENAIAQADNAGDAPEGTLCYIRSTGVFNLPAQEMTDEEMLEIIDFQHKMSYAAAQNGWTQEKVEGADRKDRATREEMVRESGGLSEDEAIAIAKKTMEADLGEKAKGLEVCTDSIYGWRSDLCIANWSEIKEEDKGALAYSIAFNNAEDGMDWKDLINYTCVVNAVDGSILEAYAIQGVLDGFDDVVYYEH